MLRLCSEFCFIVTVELVTLSVLGTNWRIRISLALTGLSAFIRSTQAEASYVFSVLYSAQRATT